jgi:hypothetical protein
MKKQVLATLAFCALSLASYAMAAGLTPQGGGIVGSAHDMRGVSGSKAGGLDQDVNTGRVCAFCHTPHHADTTNDASGATYLPLWSRTIDTKTFATPYTSPTMDAAEWNADIAVGPTRLCMSCHDGTIAPDQHYGNDATASGDLLSGDILGGTRPMGVGAGALGLTNDHPVGFNYNAIAVGKQGQVPKADVTKSGQDPWIADGSATYINNALTGLKVSDRLYTVGSASYMTCATCHDVHNRKNKYTSADDLGVNYFTLAPQAGSALCVTCHIK